MNAALLREELLFIGNLFDRARVPNTDAGNGQKLSMAERATAAVAMLTGVGPEQLNVWVRAALDDAGRLDKPDPVIDAKVPRPRLIAVALLTPPGIPPLLTLTLSTDEADAASIGLLMELVDVLRSAAFDPKPVLPHVRKALEQIAAADVQSRKEAN